MLYCGAINKNFNLACSLALINDYLLELRSFSITLIKINYKLFIYFHTVTEYDIEVVFVYTLLVI